MTPVRPEKTEPVEPPRLGGDGEVEGYAQQQHEQTRRRERDMF